MRIRTVKPDFYKDEDLAEHPPLTRILFEGLWGLADKEGRLEDRPKYIKAEILPYDKCDSNKMLQNLHSTGFINRYEVEGRRYIHIIKFTEHQRISGKEAEPESKFPAPPDGEATGKQRGSVRDDLESQEGKGREGNEERKGKEGIEIPEDLKANETEILNWISYKREKNQSYKPTGLNALWRILRAIPADQRRAAIDASMANNYAGIFPPKGGQNGTVTGAKPIAGKYAD